MVLFKTAYDSLPEKYSKTWIMSKQYFGIRHLLITSATLQFPCRLVLGINKHFLLRMMIYNYRTKMLTQIPFKTASVLKYCFLSDLHDHTYVRIETICKPFNNNSLMAIYQRNININYYKVKHFETQKHYIPILNILQIMNSL